MQYAVEVRGATKDEVLEAVSVKLDEVSADHSDHAMASHDAVASMVAELADDENRDIVVQLNGSIASEGEVTTRAAVAMSCFLAEKIATA